MREGIHYLDRTVVPPWLEVLAVQHRKAVVLGEGPHVRIEPTHLVGRLSSKSQSD